MTESDPALPFVGSRRSDTALRQITALIHDGRFAPGERLPPERDFSDMLSVSRPTLRDALNRLEAMGYVDRRTGSGNYVCNSIPEGIRTPLEDGIREKLVTLQEIIDVRRPLEIWGAKQAASNRSAAQIAELQQALQGMLAAKPIPEEVLSEEYARSDVRFHQIIAKMTGNPVYLHTLHFLTDLIAQCLTISREVSDLEFIEANNERHQAILEAIEQQRPVDAGKAMAAHFALVERRIRVPQT